MNDVANPFEQLAIACHSIVAVPTTIDVSPPYAVRYGGIGIVTKTGSYLYVGAELVGDSDGCQLGNVHYWVPERSRYEQLSATRRQRMVRGLPQVVKDAELAKNLRIHIVSDWPLYRGMNLDSAISTGAAMVLLLANDVLGPAALDELTGMSMETGAKDSRYQRLYSLAWQIEVLLSKYRPEGHHIHAVLTRTSSCTVFWRDSKPAPTAIEPLLKDKPFSFNPVGHRLEELTAQPAKRGVGSPSSAEPPLFMVDPLLGVDIAAVFIGREVDSEDAYAAHRLEYRRRVDQLALLVKATVHREGHEASKARFWTLLEDSTTPDGEALKAEGEPSTLAADNMMDLLVVKSVEIFAHLLGLVKHGMTRSGLRNLVLAVDQSQDMYRLLDLSSGMIDEASHVLRAELRDLTKQKVAVRLMGAGRGGCLLVVAGRGSLAAALPVALERVRAKLALPAWLPNVHWQSFEGIREDQAFSQLVTDSYVKQYLSEDASESRLFPFATSKTLLVREWRGGQAQELALFDRSTWGQRISAFDVVFDLSDELDIWCNGKQLWPPASGTPAASNKQTRGNATASPARAAEILSLLFQRAHTGSSSVSLTANEIFLKFPIDAYHRASYVMTLLKDVSKGAIEGAGINTLALAVGPNTKKERSGYQLVATPGQARIAVVWRWPRARVTPSVAQAHSDPTQLRDLS